MPAKEIMPLFRKGKLHSGSSSGPIVKDESQARAIQLSYARKEGANIPEPKADNQDKKKRQSIGARISRGGHGFAHGGPPGAGR